MLRTRVISIRGRLVLWYLGVLAVVLAGLGLFQTVTLGTYLTSATADTLRQAARSELTLAGSCFIRSPSDLQDNAETLARLLGSHDVAVKVVSPSGQTLADHGLGPPGAQRRLRLPAATIRALIRTASPPASSAPQSLPASCSDLPAQRRTIHQHRSPHPVLANGLLLVALPLGPIGKPAGYAIVARSTASQDATLGEARLTFVLGALAALALAAVLALPIINRALRPLRRVTATAEAIAEGDVSQRANLAPAADEVGRLGRAFDAMVDRLQEALNAATVSEEHMRQFLADASHELRTPLTALRGTAQVLLRQPNLSTDDARESLQGIQEEAIRMSRLVEDLLTLSRLDAGQTLQPETVVVRPFLRRFVERYEPAWPERSIDLRDNALDGAAVYVDPDALQRMLTNLVENAARYSRTGGEIIVEGSEAEGRIQVSVRDEGPGLRREQAEHVFERFYRANKSRSRGSGGTGLGLSIVAALADGSGGSVGIETSPDTGTTVTVTLPRAEGTNERDHL